MSKTQANIDPQKIISICAWCGRKIPKNSEIFSLGAKGKPGFDVHSRAGQVVQILLVKSEKMVNAIAPTDDSQAKKVGNDLLFAICSLQCGDALKQALQEELNIISGRIQ
ncbi:MAG: hypothetical protein MUO77_09475 [Anaerolineales bacterium]|nr:hypothetical protein [Anaerolineales bacterium]